MGLIVVPISYWFRCIQKYPLTPGITWLRQYILSWHKPSDWVWIVHVLWNKCAMSTFLIHFVGLSLIGAAGRDVAVSQTGLFGMQIISLVLYRGLTLTQPRQTCLFCLVYYVKPILHGLFTNYCMWHSQGKEYLKDCCHSATQRTVSGMMYINYYLAGSVRWAFHGLCSCRSNPSSRLNGFYTDGTMYSYWFSDLSRFPLI